MHKIWDWIKKHPWETALLVFGIGALYVIYANSSSGSATSSAATTDDTAANDQLAAASLQDQTQLQAASISAGVTNNQTAASVTNTTTAASVQENADTLSAQTSQVIASLQAQVQDYATSAGENESLAQTSALEQIALAPYQEAEDELNSTQPATASYVSTTEGLIAQLNNFVGQVDAGNTGDLAPASATVNQLTTAVQQYQNSLPATPTTGTGAA